MRAGNCDLVFAALLPQTSSRPDVRTGRRGTGPAAVLNSSYKFYLSAAIMAAAGAGDVFLVISVHLLSITTISVKSSFIAQSGVFDSNRTVTSVGVDC